MFGFRSLLYLVVESVGVDLIGIARHGANSIKVPVLAAEYIAPIDVVSACVIV